MKTKTYGYYSAVDRRRAIIANIDCLNSELAQIDKDEQEEPAIDRINKLDSYTDLEKIVAFNLLYKHTLEGLEYLIENGYDKNDNEYFTYELAVSLTLGDVAFGIINEIL